MCWRKIRTQREWNVQIVGRGSSRLRSASPRQGDEGRGSLLSTLDFRLSTGFGRSLRTRSCISRAALLVKVTARIFPGATPLAMRCAMRNVMTRVLPVPAPARISSGPLRVSTAWRCWGLSEFRFNTRAEFNFRSAQCNVVEVFFCVLNPAKSVAEELFVISKFLQLSDKCLRAAGQIADLAAN